MKEKTAYISEDKGIFWKEEDCINHEQLVKQIKEIKESVLPAKYDTCAFGNGEGYIQLSQERVDKFMSDFRKLLKKEDKEIEEKKYKLVPMFDENPRGFVGRCLDDSGSPLYGLWGILLQIDSKNRLWGQPYFADNPNQAKQKEVARL